jgi:hypothetical protein
VLERLVKPSRTSVVQHHLHAYPFVCHIWQKRQPYLQAHNNFITSPNLVADVSRKESCGMRTLLGPHLTNQTGMGETERHSDGQ